MIKWWPFIHDPTAQVELDELRRRYSITSELTMADGEAAHWRTLGGVLDFPGANQSYWGDLQARTNILGGKPRDGITPEGRSRGGTMAGGLELYATLF